MATYSWRGSGGSHCPVELSPQHRACLVLDTIPHAKPAKGLPQPGANPPTSIATKLTPCGVSRAPATIELLSPQHTALPSTARSAQVCILLAEMVLYGSGGAGGVAAAAVS